MNRLSGISKMLITILLLLAGTYAFWFIENKTIAYFISVTFLLLLIIYLIYIGSRNKRKEKHDQRIIKNDRKVKAKILAINMDIRKKVILQLHIETATRDYICSIVLNNPNEYEKIEYEIGQNIEVFINPKNPNEVIIPEFVNENSNSTGFNWRAFFSGTLIFIISMAGPIIAVLVIFFDKSDREFQDITYIYNRNKQENLWVVKYQSPKKIYISIYDPVNQKEIKTIKDKKEKDLDNYTKFFISKQNQNIVIVGTGNTPVFDIYDATSYNKISGIEAFIKTDNILKSGISNIQKKSLNSKYNTDDIINITTNEGDKCYYNIQKNMFFYSDNTLSEYFFRNDTSLMNRNLLAFVLSPVPNNSYKKQLYIITSNNKKNARELLDLSGTESFDEAYFERNKKYNCKKCSLKLLSKDHDYLEGGIVYYDFSLIVLTSVTSLNSEADEQLTGIDYRGKITFNINEKEYPNKEQINENNFHPRQSNEFKSIRSENRMVFLFGKYGAISVDITTGKVLWKYEP